MYFHIEERQAWLRSHTHTVVSDRDPDFARFAREPSGHLRRILRIWLADRRDNELCLRAYLGAVTCCHAGPSFRELHHLLRLTTAAARAANTSARCLRRHLIALLREQRAASIVSSQ